MRLAYFIDQLQYFQELDGIGPDAKITSIVSKGLYIEIRWDNGDIGQVFDEAEIASWSKQILETKSNEQI